MSELTDKIRQRIAKVYALVERGATEGERAAAKAALDRLVKTYSLDEATISEVEVVVRDFQYTWILEHQLFFRVIKYVLEQPELLNRPLYKSARRKCICIPLNYVEWVSLSCAYEYFRRHMRTQWKLFSKPVLDRCRTTKSRTAKRKFLEEHFLSKYIIASGLFDLSELGESVATAKDREARRLFEDVKGGAYKTQVDRAGYFLT